MKPPAFVDRVVIGSLDGSNIPEFLVQKLAKRKFGKPLLVMNGSMIRVQELDVLSI